MNTPYVFKRCGKCKEWLVASTVNFQKKGGRSKYGLDCACKNCRSEYRKTKYEENREYILEQRKIYRSNNKDKISEYNKKYREENKEEINLKRRQ